VHAQLAAGRLVAQAPVQAGADQVQLGPRHRPLQPEQQAIVEVARRVDPVLVGDQRPGEGAEVEQLVPVGRGAGKPRNLKREDHADLAEPDLGDQLLEAEAALARCARAASVLVDDGDRLGRPVERERPLAQGVLARLRFQVALELRGRRLAHVDDRPPPPMLLADLGLAHRAPPREGAPPGARA